MGAADLQANGLLLIPKMKVLLTLLTSAKYVYKPLTKDTCKMTAPLVKTVKNYISSIALPGIDFESVQLSFEYEVNIKAPTYTRVPKLLDRIINGHTYNKQTFAI